MKQQQHLFFDTNLHKTLSWNFTLETINCSVYLWGSPLQNVHFQSYAHKSETRDLIFFVFVLFQLKRTNSRIMLYSLEFFPVNFLLSKQSTKVWWFYLFFCFMHVEIIYFHNLLSEFIKMPSSLRNDKKYKQKKYVMESIWKVHKPLKPQQKYIFVV